MSMQNYSASGYGFWLKDISFGDKAEVNVAIADAICSCEDKKARSMCRDILPNEFVFHKDFCVKNHRQEIIDALEYLTEDGFEGAPEFAETFASLIHTYTGIWFEAFRDDEYEYAIMLAKQLPWYFTQDEIKLTPKVVNARVNDFLIGQLKLSRINCDTFETSNWG